MYTVVCKGNFCVLGNALVLSWRLLLLILLLSDTLGGVTLGGDTPLLELGVLLLLTNISDNASIAAFNLLPVSKNGFAACGCYNASVNILLKL